VRVLHVINGELYSGAERVQDLLALRLPEFGYEVGFACLKPDKFPIERKSINTPLFTVPMKSKLDLSCGKNLASLVQNENYSLIHTHTPRAALVGRIASLLTNVPMIHHVHSPTLKDTEKVFRNFCNAFIEKIAITGITYIVSVSRSLENKLLEQGLPQEKIQVVFNGVPTSSPLPIRKPTAGKWVIGTVALFRPRKGLEVLLSALSLLKKKGISFHFKAVGSFETPQYESSLKVLARNLDIEGNIEWRGFQSDVNSELSQMDIFVLPSLYGEGMPMVILEAMATGVPVIASKVEGIPEIIEHKKTGLLVNPGCSEELAVSLHELINNSVNWGALRVRAYQRQKENFSDRAMAEAVANIYSKAIGDG